jgi:hypothetical protein
VSDETNHGEYAIRNQDVILARRLAQPEERHAMRMGAVSLYISPPPTDKELNAEVGIAYGYDGRTMVRFESISPDGRTKYMDSFSLFDVSIQAWQSYIAETYGVQVEPSALAVMKFCSEQLPLQSAPIREALAGIIKGVSRFTDVAVAAKLHVQLHDFIYKQEELKATARHYSIEKLQLQQELARSLGGFATPLLIRRLESVKEHLNSQALERLSSRWSDRGLFVDETVAKILAATHTVNINNRAGLAAENRLTLLRLKARVGQERVADMQKTERAIVDYTQRGIDTEFMTRRNDQLLAESGAGCGGNCSVSIVDLYSPEAQAARAAGMTGTLYSSMELNATSKCACIARKQQPKVVVNGKDAMCVNCGQFKINGQWGQAQAEEKHEPENITSLDAWREQKAANVKTKELHAA